MVGIEEVAKRNSLRLYKTSHPGEWKAHCPACGDHGRSYHLYVSTDKDAFYCHKCGERGGVIAFHAWLKGINFEAAKVELYPPDNNRPKRPLHPAERLTKAQLQELGYTLRTPQRRAPAGIDAVQWRRHRKAELDLMWHEWEQHESFQRNHIARLTQMLEEAQTPNNSPAPTDLRVQRMDLRQCVAHA